MEKVLQFVISLSIANFCFENGEYSFSCSGWNFHQLNFPSYHAEKDNDDDDDITPVQCWTHPECEAGDFLVCLYDADKKNYLGKVQDFDHDHDNDNEVLISFMCPNLSLNSKMQPFRWPFRADEAWVKRNSIFINIPPPEGTKRGFQISQKVFKNIDIQYRVHLHNSSSNLK